MHDIVHYSLQALGLYVHVTCLMLISLTQIIATEAPPTDSASLIIPLASGLGVALFLLVIVVVVMSVCVSLIYYHGHKSIKVKVQCS